MKIVEIEISRTKSARVPIAVPDHWTPEKVRFELIRQRDENLLKKIGGDLMPEYWDDNHGSVDLGRINLFPEHDEEPLYSFPDSVIASSPTLEL